MKSILVFQVLQNNPQVIESKSLAWVHYQLQVVLDVLEAKFKMVCLLNLARKGFNLTIKPLLLRAVVILSAISFAQLFALWPAFDCFI